MSALLIAALIAAQNPVDSVSSEATLYLEANEGGLQAEESWAVRNLGAVAVPASALAIQLPPGISQIRAEGDGSSGFEVATDNRSIQATAALPPGETRVVTVRYLLPLGSSKVSLSRVAPFSVGRWRVILEDQPDLSLASNQKVVRSERELNGVRFALWELAELAPGTHVDLMLSGLPVRSPVPQGLALLAGVLIIGWAVSRSTGARARAAGGARTKVKEARGGAPVAPLSGVARRERLVRAVELLDQDHAQGKLDAEQHGRRRRALVAELALVLRQIELESSGPSIRSA